MYGMFFFLLCFLVVLSCSVFVQKKTYKTYKPKKPKKPKKNLKTFFKNLVFSSPALDYASWRLEAVWG